MNNNEYWIRRFELLEKESYENALSLSMDVQSQFELANRNIQKEIETWYQRFADNN